MKEIIYLLLPVYRLLYHYFDSTRIGIYMNFLKLKLRRLGRYSRIYFAKIPEPFNVSIGHHVYINHGCDIITTSSRVDIGNYVMFGPHVTLVAQNHDFSGWQRPMILNSHYRRGDIQIEDDVWVGANVTVLAGVTIHRGAVIGAGAVVTKDIPPFTVVGGVPAVFIRNRTKDLHYRLRFARLFQ